MAEERLLGFDRFTLDMLCYNVVNAIERYRANPENARKMDEGVKAMKEQMKKEKNNEPDK